MSKIAVVTGAGSGVGRAVAIKLVAQGWRVALIGRTEETLRKTAELTSNKEACMNTPLRVGDAEATQRVIGSILGKSGTIDLLVNAAGTNVPKRSLEVLSMSDYHEMMDSNLNGDSWSDRVFINPNGDPLIGSAARPLRNTAGQTVAYLAANPAARYVSAPLGTLPDAGRNLLQLNPINNVDLTLAKRFNFTERYRLEFAVRAFNVLNHPQYTGGYVNDVQFLAFPPTDVLTRTSFDPASTNFQKWDKIFSSNSRTLTLSLKLSF